MQSAYEFCFEGPIDFQSLYIEMKRQVKYFINLSIQLEDEKQVLKQKNEELEKELCSHNYGK